MELDDLKNSWNEVNDDGSTQQNLTNKMIDQVTQNKYASNIKKLVYPELIGIMVCLLGATYIVLHFKYLNTNFLMSLGLLTIILLLAICLISLVSLQHLYKKPDLKKSYVETLKEFAVHELQFHNLQKLNVTLCYLLLVGVVVLLSKIVNGIDLSTNKYYWTFSFTVGYIFLMFYSRWVARHYEKTLRSAKELLSDLS
jgi:hypothetical protein